MKINPKIVAAILCCLFNTYLVAGAATGEPSEVTANAGNLSVSDGPRRLVDFQFGGSLCAVCLNAFKIRLLSMPGVKNVEITVDKVNPKSGHPPKLAHAVVSFDPEKISKENLIETIKRNDFEFLAAKDKIADGEEHNLKH